MERRLIASVALGLAALGKACAQTGVQAPVELTRQSEWQRAAIQRDAPSATTIEAVPTEGGSGDDAFGAQVIVKEQERARPFTASTEIAGMLTNNVALVREGSRRDQYFVGTTSVGFNQRFAYDLRFDAGVRYSLYRYNHFRELDFQSLDAYGGLTWAPPALGGVEFSARYLFTGLTSGRGWDEFYRNHGAQIGVQKIIPLARAHWIYVGASAQWNWADPVSAERDEFAGYAGYHAQITRSLDADAAYRYSRYSYRDHEDDNHTVSIALRCMLRQWASVSASSFMTFNRSSKPVFDYDVWNGGVTLQFSARF